MSRSDPYILQASKLVALRYRDDGGRRKRDGRLTSPPRLFVLSYSLEYDEIKCLPISWEAANELVPGDLSLIGAMIDTHRREEQNVRDAAQRLSERRAGIDESSTDDS